VDALSTKYEVDRDLRQGDWRSLAERCLGAARWSGTNGGGKDQSARRSVGADRDRDGSSEFEGLKSALDGRKAGGSDL
jgi:hypothetical protein